MRQNCGTGTARNSYFFCSPSLRLVFRSNAILAICFYLVLSALSCSLLAVYQPDSSEGLLLTNLLKSPFNFQLQRVSLGSFCGCAESQPRGSDQAAMNTGSMKPLLLTAGPGDFPTTTYSELSGTTFSLGQGCFLILTLVFVVSVFGTMTNKLSMPLPRKESLR